MPSERAMEAAGDVVREVAELPDRTSPDYWPEALLVTSEELQVIVAHTFDTFAAERVKVLEETPKSDWFAGDGNALVTIRSEELRKLWDDREKFMWQVRATCVRAEKAEATLSALRQTFDAQLAAELLFLIESTAQEQNNIEYYQGGSQVNYSEKKLTALVLEKQETIIAALKGDAA